MNTETKTTKRAPRAPKTKTPAPAPADTAAPAVKKCQAKDIGHSACNCPACEAGRFAP
jgi:hypothetical protein